MNFSIEVLTGVETLGALKYISREHSFLFAESRGDEHPEGVAVVSIGTLQISVDVMTGKAMYADGFSPRVTWQARELRAPSRDPGAVHFRADGSSLVPGVGYNYLDSDDWATYFDLNSGWVCVGDPSSGDAITIATGTSLSVDAGHMKAIWLHPVMM